ncbi:MAG: hypothetical protein WA797_12810 [Acidimicrobiales bacterium]
MNHPADRARPGTPSTHATGRLVLGSTATETTMTTKHQRRPRPRRLLLGMLLLGLPVMAACGDDDTAADPVASTTTEPPTGAIAVTAVDYRYEGLPVEITVDTTLTLRNESTTEVHELVAMRLPDDESRSVEDLLALPMAELESVLAREPALVAVAAPGEEGFATVGDGRLSEPGRYVLVCFIPTGADPQAFLGALEATPGQPPQVEGGPPHFTAGMYAELTVE